MRCGQGTPPGEDVFALPGGCMDKLTALESDQIIRNLFNGDGAQVSLGESIGAFLRIEMIGKSPETASWYRDRLTGLADTLGIDRPLGDIQEADLLTWYAGLSERHQKLSTYTLHGHVRACKRFCKWLYKRGILTVDLGGSLDLPRLPRQGRKGISEGNLRAILDAAQDNPRDYALLRFMESTGVRRGGVEHLLLTDLNLDTDDARLRRRATVREKGDKERTVLMTPGALSALEAYLAERPEIDDPHVFLGQSPGQAWHGLSDEGVSAIVRRYKERLGLVGACSPHQWRHRWARRNLQRGMDLSQVSQLLGHEDVAITVKFYGQFTADQLQDAYDRYVEDLE